METLKYVSRSNVCVNATKQSLNDLATSCMLTLFNSFKDYKAGLITLDEFLNCINTFNDGIDMWANAVEYLNQVKCALDDMRV